MSGTLTQRLKQLANGIDRFNEAVGRALSWLVLALTLLVAYDVTMRYFFQSGSIAIQELEWHLFSLIFLLGAAYTLKHDAHVRLDLFYKSRFMDARHRAWVNLAGSLLFLIPFCVLVAVSAWPFVSQAYLFAEGSPDPGGLPFRWILKAAIPLGFLLLVAQGLAEALKNLAVLLDRRP